MEEKISVIIPVYNVEPYLRKCLDSVINQTYRNLEIILVDDGSPDNCGAICDEYAARDDRVIVIHKKNGGLSAAWNDGMRRATGKWLALADSDDWLDTDYFERIMASANSIGISDADIVIAGGRIDEKDEPKVVRNFSAPTVFSTEKEKNYLKIRVQISENIDGERFSDLGYPWDKLFRLSFIREHGFLFDEELNGCADKLFNFKAFDVARKVVGCTYLGYHYRFVLTGVTKKYAPTRPAVLHDYLDKVYLYIGLHGGADQDLQEALDTVGMIFIGGCLKLYYFHPQNPDSYSQTARKLRELKKMPRYEAAIHAKNSPYATKKVRVLRAALKLPWIWPVKVLYDLNERVSKG